MSVRAALEVDLEALIQLNHVQRNCFGHLGS
jgi:hypothetical protein